MSIDRRIALGVAGAAAVLELLAGQLEWVRIGEAGRNSYELFRSAQRLGFDQLTVFRVIWFLMPVATLAFGLCVVTGRSALGGWMVAAQSLVVGAAGLAVLTTGLDPGPGVMMAIPCGIVGLGAGVAAGVAGSSGGAGGPTVARRSRKELKERIDDSDPRMTNAEKGPAIDERS